MRNIPTLSNAIQTSAASRRKTFRFTGFPFNSGSIRIRKAHLSPRFWVLRACFRQFLAAFLHKETASLLGADPQQERYLLVSCHNPTYSRLLLLSSAFTVKISSAGMATRRFLRYRRRLTLTKRQGRRYPASTSLRDVRLSVRLTGKAKQNAPTPRIKAASARFVLSCARATARALCKSEYLPPQNKKEMPALLKWSWPLV